MSHAKIAWKKCRKKRTNANGSVRMLSKNALVKLALVTDNG
ncbi:MAG: hypothetical protein ACRELY_12250 [Polyangiaceae bacterium]